MSHSLYEEIGVIRQVMLTGIPMSHSLYDEVEIIRQVMLTGMPIKKLNLVKQTLERMNELEFQRIASFDAVSMRKTENIKE
jgi:predicted RNase H-like nuclease